MWRSYFTGYGWCDWKPQSITNTDGKNIKLCKLYLIGCVQVIGSQFITVYFCSFKSPPKGKLVHYYIFKSIALHL